MPDAPNRPSVPSGIVAPQPTPQSYVVNVVRVDEQTQLVALQFYSHTGSYVVFITPDEADALAEAVQGKASSARAGLIIASAMPPKAEGPAA